MVKAAGGGDSDLGFQLMTYEDQLFSKGIRSPERCSGIIRAHFQINKFGESCLL